MQAGGTTGQSQRHVYTSKSLELIDTWLIILRRDMKFKLNETNLPVSPGPRNYKFTGRLAPALTSVGAVRLSGGRLVDDSGS